MSFPYHQSVFSEPFISVSQLLLEIRKEWLIFSSANVHSTSLTSLQDLHFASAAHSHREKESTRLSSPIHTAVCMRGILRQFSTSSSVWKFQIRRWVNPPLEVVSGPYYQRTEPMWMDKPAAWSEGVSIAQSDNYTDPSLNLIKQKFPTKRC